MPKKSGPKSKKQAPAQWQKAVDASKEQDNDGTGVVHEDGVPMILEKLSADARAVTAAEMARLIGERTEVNEEYLDESRKFRKRLGGLDDRIRELATEYESGMRKVPAQKDLPLEGRT
jgi:hypothetical protein